MIPRYTVKSSTFIVFNTISPDPAYLPDTYKVPNTLLSLLPFDNFDETLGNAQVVVRDTPPEMPRVSSDVEAQYVPGMDGSAVYLDGSYGIQLSDVKKIGTSYSIAFWMKADALYDWAPFIHIGYDLLSTDYKCRLWLGQKRCIPDHYLRVSERLIKIIRIQRFGYSRQDRIFYHFVRIGHNRRRRKKRKIETDVR